MYQFPIGAMVNSFKLPLREAIVKAAEIGAQGLQMHATFGEMSPENCVGEKRKELLDFVKSNGLVFSALCGDFGKGFANPALNPALIEQSKRIVDMALDLETNIVTTHIGVVPTDKNHDRYKIMQEACFELAKYADEMGARFAVETGPETSLVLREFLDSLDSTGVSVNMDPANLVMVTGDDPVQAVYNLKDYIVHTHAKDGIMLRPSYPEKVYTGTPETYRDEDGNPNFLEVPLGQGKVDFESWISALIGIGYSGFLTIEREVGEDPESDVRMAVDFLRKIFMKI